MAGSGKAKLGELINMLGGGAAKGAGKKIAKKKKRDRLQDVMGEIKKTRTGR